MTDLIETNRKLTRRNLLGLLAAAPLSPTLQGETHSEIEPRRRKLLPIVVAPDGHLLQTSDGKPFFWLGDTAWELIHHTTREEASYYLNTRARQEYTVIQTVVLSEFNGVTEPSALGMKPFLDAGFHQPNPAYFARIAEIAAEAATLGLYVALVPAWGDKLTAPWGSGPRLFRNDNLPDARAFARFLANAMREHANIVWIFGGDRPVRMHGLRNDNITEMSRSAGFSPDQDWTPIWREFATGLAEGGVPSGSAPPKPLIVYHPQGGEQSSSVFLHDEPWLSVNGLQSGHGGGHDEPVWEWIARDYAKSPAKPTLDLEPNYEDHPVNPWPTWDPALGYFRDHDVRKQVYRSVFAGACGVTYGHHAVWGFLNERNQPLNFADMDWTMGLHRPAGEQMQYLRMLLNSRPTEKRIPDPSLILNAPAPHSLHAVAMRDPKGSFAFVYIPTSDQVVVIDGDRISATRLRIWWYDPRTGIGHLHAEVSSSRGDKEGILRNTSRLEFRSPSYGPDWILVLEDASAGYQPPGLPAL